MVGKTSLMTKDEIHKLLDESPGAVARAIEVIYDRQEADEKRERNAVHNNSVGFNKPDAKLGTTLGNTVHYGRKYGKPYAKCLNDYDIKRGRAMIKKYWKQLQEEAEAKSLGGAKNAETK